MGSKEKVPNKKELKRLRKENSMAEQKITAESKDILSEMVLYIRMSRLTPLQQEMVRSRLVSKILQGESEGKEAKEIFNASRQEICDELIKEYPEMTQREKIIRGFSTTFLCLSILIPIMSISDFIIGNFEGDNTLSVNFNVAQLVLVILTIIGSNFAVTSLFKKVIAKFQLVQPLDSGAFVKWWIVLIVTLILLIIIRWKLKYVLFSWNIFVAFCVSAAMWLVHFLIGVKTEY